MKQAQSWWDTISLLAGGKVPRSIRPHERLYLPEERQERGTPRFGPARAARLLYAWMKP
jgi:hypothetical protein